MFKNILTFVILNNQINCKFNDYIKSLNTKREGNGGENGVFETMIVRRDRHLIMLNMCEVYFQK